MSSIDCQRVGPGGVDDATAAGAAVVLRDLVGRGAALGWVEPPAVDEVGDLLRGVAAGAPRDAALTLARAGTGEVVGLGYWTRYPRPTHSRNADLQKVAVAASHQRRGVARAIVSDLVAAAADAAIEILTLDLRGDNTAAMALYESLGFRRYGVIEDFVAVREARFDKHCYALHLARR